MSTSILDAQDLIMGFPEEETDAQITLEAKFDALLNADNLNSWMKYLSAQPHYVGSPYDKKVVDFVAAKYKVWG